MINPSASPEAPKAELQSKIFVSPTKAADLLDLSKATVYRYAKDGYRNFPKLIKLSAGRSVFRVSELKAWADSICAEVEA